MTRTGDMRVERRTWFTWGYLCRGCGLRTGTWWTYRGALHAAINHWHANHQPDAVIDEVWSA